MKHSRVHLDDIRARMVLEDVVRAHGVELKRAGALWKGCCPIHVEKTPSFVVYPDQHFHCYGCGANGSVFDFVMQTRGVDFREAVRLLGDEAGLSAPTRPDPAAERQRRREHEERVARQEAERRRNADRVARMAATHVDDIARSCEWQEHPYLVRKGFSAPPGRFRRRQGALHGYGMVTSRGWLMIPIRNAANEIRNAQFISPEGEKLFHRDGETKGCFHRIAPAITTPELWLAEGYATGLSVLAALRRRSLRPEIRFCLSASNIEAVGRAAKRDGRDVWVVADHDRWSCPKCRHRWDGTLQDRTCPSCGARGTPPAGQHHAAALSRPTWIPPDAGTDANDFHATRGLDALADALVAFRYPRTPVP